MHDSEADLDYMIKGQNDIQGHESSGNQNQNHFFISQPSQADQMPGPPREVQLI